jgi:plastocyanin
MVALLGAFAAMLPAVASSETSPTIDAVNVDLYTHHWQPAQATVGVGGTVTLRNATTVAHGVEWIGPRKGECTSGVPVGTTAAASGKEWSGTCSFAQAGTYTFYCTVHGAEMSGTVTVSAGGTTTTSTTTTPTGTGTTPTTTVPTTPVETPATPKLRVSALAGGHSGGAVHGSLAISQAGAGDRLEVDLLATRASLGQAGHGTRKVRVGRFVQASVAAGTAPFRVRLNTLARRALKQHKRLKLVVRFTLTPLYGVASSVTRTVVEHG